MEDYDAFLNRELYDAWKEGFVRGVFVGGFVAVCITGFIGLIVCRP